MKLKDILDENTVYVEYRTEHPEFGDIITGSARWDGFILFGLDRDDYSVDDEIQRYSRIEYGEGIPDDLIVWYESEWITG